MSSIHERSGTLPSDHKHSTSQAERPPAFNSEVAPSNHRHSTSQRERRPAFISPRPVRQNGIQLFTPPSRSNEAVNRRDVRHSIHQKEPAPREDVEAAGANSQFQVGANLDVHVDGMYFVGEVVRQETEGAVREKYLGTV